NAWLPNQADAIVGPIDRQGSPEHQPFRHLTAELIAVIQLAPRAAVGALRAVVAKAEKMPRLHKQGYCRQVPQLVPAVGIAPDVVGQSADARVGVVGVAPQLEMVNAEGSAAGADAGRFQVVFLRGTADRPAVLERRLVSDAVVKRQIAIDPERQALVVVG